MSIPYKMRPAGWVIPAWLRSLKKELNILLAEGNFELTFDKDAQKVTIALALTTTQSQIEAVNALIERVVPQNLVIELEWADGLPMTYTRLEFLEATGQQQIKTTFKPHKLSSLARWEVTSRKTGQIVGWYDGNLYKIENQSNTNGTGVGTYIRTPVYSYARYIYDKPIGFIAEVEINADREYIRINDNNYACPGLATGYSDDVAGSINLFSQGGIRSSNSFAQARVMLIRFWRDGVELANYIPALDPTGAPCMYDTVTRKPFYNTGSGDFIYPGKESEATTYSLRNRMYAQYTEHGIRRLYHVPKGYTGSKDEYAEANGFKILEETPMPAEGYWVPVWHDREDSIELEWEETESPAEEIMEQENIAIE